MVVGRGDWCISRQRSRGVPIPVFYEKKTKISKTNDMTLSEFKNRLIDIF